MEGTRNADKKIPEPLHQRGRAKKRDRKYFNRYFTSGAFEKATKSWAVYKLAERGQLKCVRWKCLGNGIKKQREFLRFKKSDILDFIESHYN